MNMTRWAAAPVIVLAILGLAACSTSARAHTASISTTSASAEGLSSAEAAAQSCTGSGGTWDGSSCTTPSPSPSVNPPTKIEFVISGYAPGDPACGGGCGPDITYGSDSDTHNTSPEEINGTVTYWVTFDPNAQYYSIDVNTTTSDSHLACKIIATGPGDDPLTVSSGSETGSGICSAQAAPSNDGLSWQNEQ